MKDNQKSRQQLIKELAVLRRKLAECDGTCSPANLLQPGAVKPSARFALYEDLPAFVYVQESDYTISYANRKFRELFGNPGRKRCHELIGKRKIPCKPCIPFEALTMNRQSVREWESPSGERYDIHGLPFTDAGGVKKLLGFGFDVTQRKQAESREALLRFCLDSVPESRAVFSSDGSIVYANAATARNLGYRLEEIIGKRAGAFDPKEPPGAWKKHWTAVKQKGALTFESKHVRKDGTSFPVEVTSLHIAHNGQEYIFSHARDISKRQEAEKTLRESEERYRTLVDSAPDAIVTVDASGRIVSWNRGAEKIYGYAAAEIIGKDFVVTVPEKLRKKHTALFAEAIRGGRMPVYAAPAEGFARRKDGSDVMIDLRFAMHRANNRYFFTAIVRDITRRKKTETSLKESEERYRKIFTVAAEGILVAEIATMRFKYANPALCSMLGYTEQELIGRRVSDIHPRSQLKHVLAEFLAIAQGRKKWALSIPCRRKDGALLYADITGSSVFFDGVSCNLGFFSDITERKKIQEQLYQNEELLRLTFEKAPVAAVILDKTWRVLNVNEHSERVLGRAAAEIQQRGIDAYLHPEDNAKGLRALRASPERLREPHDAEIRYVAGDGHTVFARQQVQGVFNRQGELIFILVLIEDITQRKQHENVNTTIIARLRSLYRELHAFSATLPAEQSFASAGSIRDFNLSPMENRVASMLYAGYSNKKIAATLNISENTAKHHLTSIYSKCKVTNRIEFYRLIHEKRIML